jgi:hypothetical protein
LDLADFAFDAAAREDVLPVDTADCLRTLEVVVEGFADLAGAGFAGGTFAAGAVFTEAEGAGFAVFLAAGVEAPAAAEDCASRVLPVSNRQAETTATQSRDFLTNIASRSNHRFSGESRWAGAFLHCIPI